MSGYGREHTLPLRVLAGRSSLENNLVSEDTYTNHSTYDSSSNGQLAHLPAELIHRIASLLEVNPADLCHFAAVTPKNWEILRKECHQMAVKLAEPTPEEFKKYLTETNGVDRNILWDEVQDSDIDMRSNFTEAIRDGKLHAVKSFLQHGIKPDSYNIFGNRPLNLAANCPCPLEMSKLLLKYGADPNLSDILTDIFTPLYTAATMARDDMVDLLLDHGADIKQKGVVQALCQICTEGTVRRAFKMGADIREIDESGNTLIHYAARNESPGVLRTLFDLGFPLNAVNQQNTGGKTPLMKAVKDGHEHNVATLLEYGASPDIPLANGTTALHVACNWDHVEIARLLLEAGANIEAVNGDQWRPIHFAAYNLSTNMLTLLIQHGADVSTPTHNHDTALHMLLSELTEHTSKKFAKAILKKVKLLVSAKANPTAQNDLGETPLDIAMNSGHYEIAHVLSTHDAHALDGAPPAGRNWQEYLRGHVYNIQVA